MRKWLTQKSLKIADTNIKLTPSTSSETRENTVQKLIRNVCYHNIQFTSIKVAFS